MDTIHICFKHQIYAFSSVKFSGPNAEPTFGSLELRIAEKEKNSTKNEYQHQHQLTTVQESKDTISTVNIIAKVSSPLVHNVNQVH